MEDGIEQHMSIMTNYIVTKNNEKKNEKKNEKYKGAMCEQHRELEQIKEKEKEKEKEAKPYQNTECTKEKQD
jgi:hypothetical protein